jgi:hypothetical protein
VLGALCAVLTVTLALSFRSHVFVGPPPGH